MNRPILTLFISFAEVFLIDPSTLTTIRRARLSALQSISVTSYTDAEQVAMELDGSKLLFRRNGWRSIDITGKAVEENASRILEYYDLAVNGPA